MEDSTTLENVSNEVVMSIAENVVAENTQRHFLAVFFLSFIWGVFGVDRFYLGKYWTGLLKLLTFGGFGIWAAIDLSWIMKGLMRDKQGNPLLEYEKYKGFAKKTVGLFWFILIVSVVVIGALSTYELIQFFQNGGFQKIQDTIVNSNFPGLRELQQQLQQLQVQG